MDTAAPLQTTAGEPAPSVVITGSDQRGNVSIEFASSSPVSVTLAPNLTIGRGNVSMPPTEEQIEAAYWEFDARKKGVGEWSGRPQSERDAFKWTLRKLLA